VEEEDDPFASDGEDYKEEEEEDEEEEKGQATNPQDSHIEEPATAVEDITSNVSNMSVAIKQQKFSMEFLSIHSL
jgi:hypothetical protein